MNAFEPPILCASLSVRESDAGEEVKEPECWARGVIQHY